MADPTAISSENAPIIIQIIEISLLFLLPNELKKTQLSFAFLKIHGPYVRAHFALRLYQIEGSCMNSEFRGEKLSDSLNDYAHI